MSNVNHPNHYNQGGVECIEAMKASTVGLEGIEAVCTAQVIKYIWRWKNKNGIEDLEKAEWYLNYLKNYLKTEEDKKKTDVKPRWEDCSQCLFYAQDETSPESKCYNCIYAHLTTDPNYHNYFNNYLENVALIKK